MKPHELPSPQTADVYRQLLDSNNQQAGARRWVKRGILGLGVAALAGWAWRKMPVASSDPKHRPRL